MKTNKFEETLRRKLEGIQPDYTEQDWRKLQAFRQKHASPGFLQTYGQWLGYAAAAATTVVVLALYTQQVKVNKSLEKEMAALKTQVLQQQITPPAASAMPPRDTIYVVERQTIYRDRLPEAEDLSRNEVDKKAAEPVATENTGKQLSTDKQSLAGNISTPQRRQEMTAQSGSSAENVTQESIVRARESNFPGNMNEKSLLSEKENDSPALAMQENSSDKIILGDLEFLKPSEFLIQHDRLQKRLTSRIPQKKNNLLLTTTNTQQAYADQKATAPQKSAKEQKTERIVPDFGLPFRAGLAQQWEGPTNTFSLAYEVLLGKRWGIQSGLAWQRLEPQKFFTEKTFRDDMKKDFRKEHADRLPPNFRIFNINTRTTLLQIPLSVAYRGDLTRNFSYFMTAGTNLNLRANQTLTYDFERPSQDFGQESKERTMSFPLINNAVVSAGIEKRWSPIVLQVDSFLNTKFNTFSYLRQRTSVGLRVKVLYEFGSTKSY
ncbi:porin family protein [Arundinibacter roseus]|uniref:Outer membrane protein beta-barrel domain-containing protein n=1 Tax=Arundinibacter roseus TaxID=2070510 RepID=A0A4R4K4E9_9BACT|nr:hypothetical protein [Arundinibacter roseus]TDB61361.1 hypothetical protein EZE20_19340 [Arundinibacter roseus]